MKRLSRQLPVLVMALILAFSVAACSEGSDARIERAYARVHSTYVGVVTVSTTDGKITDVKFDEMQTPKDWAKKTALADTVQTDDSDFDENGYAKKIKIGDKVFTLADALLESPSGAPDYRADGMSEDFYVWLDTEENAQWYYEQMRKGNYYILKADATALGGEENIFAAAANGFSLDKGSRWLKTKNGYWTSGYGMGWTANMSAIESFIIRKNGMGAYTGESSADNSSGSWQVGDVNTGATLVDFNQYMALAQKAVAKLGR